MPELELAVAVKVFKNGFGIFLEPVEEKPYYVRFRELKTNRTVEGLTHSRGTKINPRFILHILQRFEISVPDFLDALAATTSQKKGPQQVAS